MTDSNRQRDLTRRRDTDTGAIMRIWLIAFLQLR